VSSIIVLLWCVRKREKRWAAAQIYCDSKKHRLGTFGTKQEAALAYDSRARQCGEDKLLNYESIAAAEEAAVQAQAEPILQHDMCAGPKKPKPCPSSGFYGVCPNNKRWKAMTDDPLRRQKSPPRHFRHQAGGSTRIRLEGKQAVREG
jgi:hypothetical protein